MKIPALILFFPLPLAHAQSHIELFEAAVKKSSSDLTPAYRRQAMAIHQDQSLTPEQKEKQIGQLNIARQELEDRPGQIEYGKRKVSIEEMCEMDLFGRLDQDPAEGVVLSSSRRQSIASIFGANISFTEMLNSAFGSYLETLRRTLLPEKRVEFNQLIFTLGRSGGLRKAFEINERGLLDSKFTSLGHLVVAIYEIEHARQLILGGRDYISQYLDDPSFRESRKRIALRAEWEFLSVVPFAIFRRDSELFKVDPRDSKHTRVALENARASIEKYIQMQEQSGFFASNDVEPFMGKLLQERTLLLK